MKNVLAPYVNMTILIRNRLSLAYKTHLIILFFKIINLVIILVQAVPGCIKKGVQI